MAENTDDDFAECTIEVRPASEPRLLLSARDHLPARAWLGLPREPLPRLAWLGLTAAAMQFGVSLADVADDVAAWTHALVLPIDGLQGASFVVYNPAPYALFVAVLRPVLSFDAQELDGGRGGAGIVRMTLLLGAGEAARIEESDARALVEWRPFGPPRRRSPALQPGDSVSWVCGGAP